MLRMLERGSYTVRPVMTNGLVALIVLVLLLLFVLPADAQSQDGVAAFAGMDISTATAGAGDNSDGDAPAIEPVKQENKKDRRGKLEFKRENTARGTDEESTKTSLKMFTYLNGFVTLFRLEFAFPDAKTDFEGDPFNPRQGDTKMRFGFRQFRLHTIPLDSFVEFTFPTAQPENLGGGKYQVSPGIETVFPLGRAGGTKAHRVSGKLLLQHFLSVAGDESRKDINYSKIEFTLKDTWRKYWLSFLFKPALDWVQDAKTGAVGEVEVGWNVTPDWSVALKGGHRLWGEGVPSTYSKRGTLTVAYMY